MTIIISHYDTGNRWTEVKLPKNKNSRFDVTIVIRVEKKANRLLFKAKKCPELNTIQHLLAITIKPCLWEIHEIQINKQNIRRSKIVNEIKILLGHFYANSYRYFKAFIQNSGLRRQIKTRIGWKARNTLRCERQFVSIQHLDKDFVRWLRNWAKMSKTRKKHLCCESVLQNT